MVDAGRVVSTGIAGDDSANVVDYTPRIVREHGV